MLLFIIRHAEPIYNPDTLTEKGHKQARALVKRFSVHGLDRIYSSPHGRARETAEPTATALGLDINILPWTAEGPAYQAFSRIFPDGKRWWAYTPSAGPELMSDEYARMNTDEVLETPLFEGCADTGYINIVRHESDEFLKSLGYERQGDRYKAVAPNDQRIAVFCHAGFGTLWMSHLTGVPLHRFGGAFEIPHSSVSVIEFRQYGDKLVAPRVISLSDMSHLLDSDVPYEANGTVKL